MRRTIYLHPVWGRASTLVLPNMRRGDKAGEGTGARAKAPRLTPHCRVALLFSSSRAKRFAARSPRTEQCKTVVSTLLIKRACYWEKEDCSFPCSRWWSPGTRHLLRVWVSRPWGPRFQTLHKPFRRPTARKRKVTQVLDRTCVTLAAPCYSRSRSGLTLTRGAPLLRLD